MDVFDELLKEFPHVSLIYTPEGITIEFLYKLDYEEHEYEIFVSMNSVSWETPKNIYEKKIIEWIKNHLPLLKRASKDRLAKYVEMIEKVSGDHEVDISTMSILLYGRLPVVKTFRSFNTMYKYLAAGRGGNDGED